MKYITTIDDQDYIFDVNSEGQVTLNGEFIQADMRATLDPTFYSIIIDRCSHDVRIKPGKDTYTVQVGGEIFEVTVKDERTHRLAGLKGTLGATTGQAIIRAPMPGVVVDVLVTEAQEVAKGDIIVVLESMKMQNEFKAPRAGKVHAVRVARGDQVNQNDIMITIA